jgi:hypothetical protein
MRTGTSAAMSEAERTEYWHPCQPADALVQLAGRDEQLVRFPAGADAVNTFEQRAKALLAQADANRDLSGNLAHDDA